MDKKDWAINELSAKYTELGRLPTKEDFEPEKRLKIKNTLGPWPRALEAAGIKSAGKKKA